MCFRQFTDPKLLPCCVRGVCAACVPVLWARNPRSCPHCTQPIAADVDPAKLLDDFVSAGLVYALQCRTGGAATVRCHECDEDRTAEVVGCCKRCHTFLCAIHFAAHSVTKITKSHEVASLEEMGGATEVMARRPRL